MAISLASLQQTTTLHPAAHPDPWRRRRRQDPPSRRRPTAGVHRDRGRARHARGAAFSAGDELRRGVEALDALYERAARLPHRGDRQRRLARAADLGARPASDNKLGARSRSRATARATSQRSTSGANTSTGLNALRDERGMTVHPDRAHRHQALRQPRARALRPLRHQAARPRRGAAAGALRRRALRQLPHQHGEVGRRLQQEGHPRARERRACHATPRSAPPSSPRTVTACPTCCRSTGRRSSRRCRSP